MVSFNITESNTVLFDVNNTTTLTPPSFFEGGGEGGVIEEDLQTSINNNGHSNDDYYPLTNEAETLTARILPRITALISLLGVVCVAMEAYGDVRGSIIMKNGNSTTTRRGRGGAVVVNSTRQINNDTVSHIQLFYQLALFCYTLAFVLGSTPAPSDQPIWGAYGNQATCTAQGALFQFGMYASIGWDIALSTTYWTMTRRSGGSGGGSAMRNGSTNGRGNENNIKKPWKLLWHVIIWPIALGVSIYPLVATDLYNFNNNLCWINEYPNDCHLPEVPHDCVRGEHDGATLWTNMASFAAILHLMYSTVVMIALYCSIRKIEAAMEERRRRHSQQLHQSTAMTVATSKTNASVTSTTTVGTRQYSRKIAIQGMLYASGMMITMLPTAIMVLLANLVNYWSFQLAAFCLTMVPLAGYINFFIYLRNRSIEQCHTRYAIFLRKIHCNFEWWSGCNKICCWFPRLLVWLCCCVWLRKRQSDNSDGSDYHNDIEGHPKSSSHKSSSSRFGTIQLTLPQLGSKSSGSGANNNNNNNKKARAISQLTCSIDDDGFTSQNSAAFDDVVDDAGIVDISPIPIDLDEPRQPGNILDQSETNSSTVSGPPPLVPFPHHGPEQHVQEQDCQSPLLEQHPHGNNRDRYNGDEADPLQQQQQPSVPKDCSSQEKKNNNNKKKWGSSKTSGPFKVWVSEASDFETWRSEADELVFAAAGSSTEVKNNNNNSSSTDFRVWKSEISEFETWQSELEENPNPR